MNKKTEKRNYFCNKCGTIHHYLYHKKPSKTHESHLKHKLDFIENLSSSLLFNLNFKRNWKNYDIEKHKERYSQ